MCDYGPLYTWQRSPAADKRHGSWILWPCPGFWNQLWIPEEGCERRANLGAASAITVALLITQTSLRGCLSPSEHCSRWSFLVWTREYLLSTASSFHVGVQAPHRDSFSLLHLILQCFTLLMSCLTQKLLCMCQSCSYLNWNTWHDICSKLSLSGLFSHVTTLIWQIAVQVRKN